MIESTSPGSDIVMSDLWFWLILVIFVVTFGFALMFVVDTFKQRSSRLTYWKNFWSVVEIVWLIGAATSIFGLISPAWGLLGPYLTDKYIEMAQDDLQEAQIVAAKIEDQYCSDGDNVSEFCVVLSEIRQLNVAIDPVKVAKIFQTYMKESNTFQKEKDIEDLKDGGIWWGLDNAVVILKDAKHEKSKTFPFPAWIFWLRGFSPHLFAFVFALRLARAIAVFAFS